MVLINYLYQDSRWPSFSTF